jgi:pimeloyl-ACP methyl ester carboxylesterase
MLLAAAQVQRPLVLAGHSAGGLFVREYAREFPSDVAGVVLVDSSSPEQLDELPGFRQSFEENLRRAQHNLWHDRFRVWSGWERLSGACKTTPGKGLAGLQGQYDAQACRPAYVGTDLQEFLGLETSAAQAARLTSFGYVPLLVVSRDTI